MGPRVKICFVSTFGYGLFNPRCPVLFGGAQVQFYQLARHLSENDRFEVSCVVADSGQPSPEQHGRIIVHRSFRLEKRLGNYLAAPFLLLGALRHIAPDVVLQRGADPETCICALYCFLWRKRFVFSVAHEIDVDGSYARNGLRGLLYRLGLVLADRIIIQNRDQGRLLERWRGTRHAPITFIKSAYPLRHRRKREGRYVLWVARSDAWKRPEAFLKLVRSFPKMKFLMIMPKSSDTATWNRAVSEASALRNVEVLGTVPFMEIQAYFEGAQVFVNTSTKEGFPNTFIQSCLASVPILSLNVDPDKFLERSGCGFFCHDNPALLRKGLRRLLENRALRVRMGEAAYRYMKKNHDLATVAREWEEMLRKL